MKLLHALLAALLALPLTAVADPVGSAFTYQGRLDYNGAPAHGSFDLKFDLFDVAADGAPVAASVEWPAQTVTGGLFAVDLDFGGSEIFNGTAYWIEMQARPAGAVDYVTVPGRTAVRPTPYAVRAASVMDGAVTGTSLADGSITGEKLAPGAVTPAQLSAAAAPVAGQVLGFDGDGLSWVDPAAGGGGGSGPWLLNGSKAYYTAGFVGVGNSNPLAPLHVTADWVAGETPNVRLSGSRPTLMWVRNRLFPEASTTDHWLAHMSGTVQGNIAFYHRNINGTTLPVIDTGYRPVLSLTPARSVGINIENPGGQLHVFNSTSATQVIETGGDVNSWSRLRLRTASGDWDIGTSREFNGNQLYITRGGTATVQLGVQPNGDVYAAGDVTATRMILRADPGAPTNAAVLCADPGATNFIPYNTALGRAMNVVAHDITAHDASVRQLTIRGGADLAEPFAMSHAGVEPGSVVVIDEHHPGKLRRSTTPYDKKVAGIVSGANGIHPGISMIQEDRLEAGENVALSGRVYVHANTDAGDIEPGDLLTTSAVAGQAMKAADHDKAQGAIIGKAMTSLDERTGLVLVLVTLQ